VGKNGPAVPTARLEEFHSDMMPGLRRLVLLGALAPMALGCDTTPDVTEGPSPLPPTQYSVVQIEYRQPNGCANVPESCVDRVVFFGSWMRSGEEILLDGAPGHIWVGQATNVPVNWPPTISAHRVRVFDPHLVQTDSGGVTATRIRVGGEPVTHFEDLGTPSESARVYVDVNGIGHNPP
jgi:hypothetical protein